MTELTLITNAIQINPPPMNESRSVYRQISPKDSDYLTLSDYTTRREVGARCVDAKVHETDYRCPGCSAERMNAKLDHGCHIVCGCGLEAQVFGNSITVWKTA